MIINDCVLNPRRYTGPVPPPAATLEDVSPYGNNGTINNADWVRLVSGLWVLDFDGVGDSVGIPSTPSLEITGNITCAIWARGTTFVGDFRTPMGKGAGADYYFRTRATGSTFFTVTQAAAAKASPEQVLDLDAWYLLVGVYNGARVYFYANAVRGAGTAAAGPIDTAGANLTIGMRVSSNDDLWIGQLTWPRVWPWAFTDAQVWTMFNNERGWFAR
tara:strand:+ start:3397 stop:4047 length:651 start_codon:yes stop_codon:yes gene_type:complete